jgi:hypothetical protein
MKKWFAVVAVCALSVVSLRADVTVTTTMTMEGAAAANLPQGALPKITLRVKGMKSRSDIETAGTTVSVITDLTTRQVITLMPSSKTAQVTSAETVAAGGAPIAMPKIDASLKPTGKSQTLEGVVCDEHTFTMLLDMSSMAGAQMPPEAAEMLKGVKMAMNGSIWVAKSAPGVEEIMAFNKAALSSGLLAAVSGIKPGQPGGIEQLLTAAATAPGLPYLTEMTVTVQGEGPMVEAMKQMGTMKMVQKVSAVSTDPIGDDLFTVPAGYTVDKK